MEIAVRPSPGRAAAGAGVGSWHFARPPRPRRANPGAHGLDRTVRPIHYGNRTVDLCDGDDVLLTPEIAALEPEHPTRRFVWMPCVYSAELHARALGGAYSADAAGRYARRHPLPDELLEAPAAGEDHELAEVDINRGSGARLNVGDRR
jgi:hypothetical protein